MTTRCWYRTQGERLKSKIQEGNFDWSQSKTSSPERRYHQAHLHGHWAGLVVMVAVVVVAAAAAVMVQCVGGGGTTLKQLSNLPAVCLWVSFLPSLNINRLPPLTHTLGNRARENLVAVRSSMRMSTIQPEPGIQEALAKSIVLTSCCQPMGDDHRPGNGMGREF